MKINEAQSEALTSHLKGRAILAVRVLTHENGTEFVEFDLEGDFYVRAFADFALLFAGSLPPIPDNLPGVHALAPTPWALPAEDKSPICDLLQRPAVTAAHPHLRPDLDDGCLADALVNDEGLVVGALHGPETVETLLGLVEHSIPRVTPRYGEGLTHETGEGFPTLEEIASWDQATREAVCEWAAAVHVRASDNPEQPIPEVPKVLLAVPQAKDGGAA